MLIDTHCHLDAAEFDVDRTQVAQAALDAGVGMIVVPAVERANFGAVASVCREHAHCVPAYGIHPMYVDRAHEGDLAALRKTLARERPVAVGEIGLDRFVTSRDDERQIFYFTEQLKIAQAANLPVLLHVRASIDAVLTQLRRTPVPGGIAHAFNGSRQQAEEFIKLGFKLGFGGVATWPRARRIRELVTTLPLDAIVLETDSPDLPPHWLADQRNSPDQLPQIAEVLAELRGLTMQEFVAATTYNARNVLPNLTTRRQ